MIYKNENTVGIDFVIDGIQDDIYNDLKSRWIGEHDSYGRVYLNPVSSEENLKIAEFYKGEDYEDVYLNDSVNSTSFFLTGDQNTTEDELKFVNSSKIVFMVNLNGVTGLNGRPDEIVKRDIIESLRSLCFERFIIKGISTGLDALNEIDRSGNLKMANMNPYAVFVAEIDLSYYLDDKVN